MTKGEFLLRLQDKLSGFSREEAEERLNFYREMIEDRMEEGLAEEEAVAAVGTVEEIVGQIVADMPLSKGKIEEKKQKKPGKTLEILLLVLGSPLWLALLIAAFAVILSLYISLWSIVISLWAVFVSLAACSLGSIVAALAFVLGSNKLTGILMIGTGCVCAGCAVFLFFGCKAATKGIAELTKKMALWIKNFFIKRGKHNA